MSARTSPSEIRSWMRPFVTGTPSLLCASTEKSLPSPAFIIFEEVQPALPPEAGHTYSISVSGEGRGGIHFRVHVNGSLSTAPQPAP